MEKQVPEQKSDFLIEKIKGRPISKRKLVKKTITTVSLALLFGLVACCTFLFLQPYLRNLIQKDTEIEPQVITFPEDPVEMEPEEMLAEKLEEETPTEPAAPLEEEQIQEILSEVTFDIGNYAQMYGALSDYVQDVKRSMVTITCVDSNVDWLNSVQEKKNKTCGAVIANNKKDLLIVTYYENVKDAESMFVRFYGGIQAEATLNAYDADTGLAVVSVPLTNMGTEYWNDTISIATMGATNLRNLETSPVVAVGMPMGTEDSVGYGMITATTAQMQYTDANIKVMQTDILGSQSATGMLFNLNGELIGVITDHKPENMDNVIMAYGISDLKKLLAKMSNGEPKAYIGLKGTLVTLEAYSQLNIPYGAYIQEVDMNSPAMMAGLLVGDVITEMNDQQVLSFADYSNVLYGLKPREKVTMSVYRLVQDEYKLMKVELETDEVH